MEGRTKVKSRENMCADNSKRTLSLSWLGCLLSELFQDRSNACLVNFIITPIRTKKWKPGKFSNLMISTFYISILYSK